MESSDTNREEIARLRRAVDELGYRQAEEIARLRNDLKALEAGLAPPKPPPSLPARPVTKVPEAGDKSGGVETPPVSGSEQPTEAPAPAAVPATAPEAARGSFELELGRVWLVRLGIAVLVTGLVLLGNYAYQNWIRELPAALRLGGLLGLSLGLSGVGWKLAAKENLQRFGEVVLGGGLAFFYWCVYAGHHVERLRVIDSPVLGAIAVLGAAGAIVAVALRRDSRTTAVAGLLLASYATILQPLGWMSGISNGVLAAAAVGLMLRAGWAAPGVAGLVGTWVSFLWWQLGGAAGGGLTPAALAFVATSWVVFLLPGLPGFAGRFGGSLDERGRAWFAGGNNAACFAMLSLIWMALGYLDYWRLPAGFGALLVVLGLAGRDRELSGSTHLVQGLAALSAALVLRLDGYHLALGLALEALVLAGAFARFRKLPELGFSLMAMGAAGVVTLVGPAPGWCGGVVALLMLATVVVWRTGADRLDGRDGFRRDVLTMVGVGMAVTTLVAVIGWCWQLPEALRAGLAQAVALGLALVSLRIDRRGWLPELRWSAAAFAVAGAALLVGWRHEVADGALWLIAGLSAAAGWLWEKSAEEKSGAVAGPPLGWLHGLTAALAVFLGVASLGLATGTSGWLYVLAGPALAIGALRGLGCPRLGTALGLLIGAGFVQTQGAASVPAGLGFGFVAAALVTLGSARDLAGREPLAAGLLAVAMRLTAVAGWLVAWAQVFPDGWIEVVALGGGLLLVARRRADWSVKLPEAWLLLVVSVLDYGLRLTMPVLDLGELSVVSGWGLVAGWAAAGFACRGVSRVPLLWVACGMLGLWVTRGSVELWGWEPVAITWTALGFALVSVGLWRQVATLRQAGFLLLAVALVKLFALDVWDFGAFTRVVAFLALGVALVVLGFFYNRFAGLLKRLLE